MQEYNNMRLLKLFEEVKEENLNKEQLEQYFSELSQLMAQVVLELAEKEKEEGIFMGENIEEKTATRKREWKRSQSGQRLIQLKAYKTAGNLVLQSIKTRIYAKL